MQAKLQRLISVHRNHISPACLRDAQMITIKVADAEWTWTIHKIDRGCSWLLPLFYGFIFQTLSPSKLLRSCAHTRGLWHPSCWFCSFSFSHMYFCLPVAFMQSLGFWGNLCSRRKQLNCGFLLCSESQSLPLSQWLPVLSSQGLVLVLIKAVSFCILPAFSTACCGLRGNSDTEWKKEWGGD